MTHLQKLREDYRDWPNVVRIDETWHGIKETCEAISIGVRHGIKETCEAIEKDIDEMIDTHMVIRDKQLIKEEIKQLLTKETSVKRS